MGNTEEGMELLQWVGIACTCLAIGGYHAYDKMGMRTWFGGPAQTASANTQATTQQGTPVQTTPSSLEKALSDPLESRVGPYVIDREQIPLYIARTQYAWIITYENKIPLSPHQFHTKESAYRALKWLRETIVPARSNFNLARDGPLFLDELHDQDQGTLDSFISDRAVTQAEQDAEPYLSRVQEITGE